MALNTLGESNRIVLVNYVSVNLGKKTETVSLYSL